MHVALYLRDILKTAETVSPIECAVYSIAWAHNIAGVSSPTQNPFVTSTLAGCKRLLAKPIVRKKPIQPHMLETFMDSFADYTDDLDQLRTLFVVLVGYAGFLRISELLQLQVRHLTINVDHMILLLPKRKNDQFRKGHTVYIAGSNKKACPVAIAELLAHKPGDEPNSPYPLVRRIQHTKDGKRFHPTLGISYSRIRDIIKSKFAWALFRRSSPIRHAQSSIRWDI